MARIREFGLVERHSMLRAIVVLRYSAAEFGIPRVCALGSPLAGHLVFSAA